MRRRTSATKIIATRLRKRLEYFSVCSDSEMGKLIARSEEMHSKLPDSKVIAVLTTARPRVALSKVEVEKAKRDDIVLLVREDIDDL